MTDGRQASGSPRCASWLERLLLWRVWERMLELEFVDRGVALAGKAFVSFFPLTIVVAAFLPEGMRESIVKAITVRFGLRGDALDLVQQSFASSEDLQEGDRTARAHLHGPLRHLVHDGPAARLPPGLAAATPGRARQVLARPVVPRHRARLDGAPRERRQGHPRSGRRHHGRRPGVGDDDRAWLIIPWILLRGDVRLRVLVPTAVITSVITFAYSASASVWMPETVTSNEAQFGLFGVALALVSWFSGAAICILVGACIGPVLAEDTGWIGALVRGSARAAEGRRRAVAARARPGAHAPGRVPG